MPEGPEVRLFASNINKKFKGAVLNNVIITSGRYSKKTKPKNYEKFLKELPLTIKNINNKGKFIWIKFNNDEEISIWITLGLTGILSIVKDKHTHFIFETSKGNFYMSDMRNFGTVSFYFSKKELDKKLDSLGPDPLDKTLTKADFIKIMRKRKQDKPIVMVLNDQKVIAGIGNYLRSEILYHSGISPHRKLEDLSDQELDRIAKSINTIIRKSYETQVKKGLHQYPFLIYQRKTTDKGEKIYGEMVANGRTIWWVPEKQH